MTIFLLMTLVSRNKGNNKSGNKKMTICSTRKGLMVVNMASHQLSMHGVLQMIFTAEDKDVLDCEPITRQDTSTTFCHIHNLTFIPHNKQKHIARACYM